MNATTPRITLDHIAIAVPDLAQTVQALESLFSVHSAPVEEVPSEEVRLSFLDVGNARIEVLEPTARHSAIGRFVGAGRTGVHHLSFRVEGVELGAFCASLKARGVEIVGEGLRPGAESTRVFFVNPRSTGGVLVEFSQKEPSA